MLQVTQIVFLVTFCSKFPNFTMQFWAKIPLIFVTVVFIYNVSGDDDDIEEFNQPLHDLDKIGETI